MKIAFDENIPSALVNVFRTLAKEKQFRNSLGAFEIGSAKDYTPNVEDSDYKRRDDSPWIKRFAAAGGKVIISGNTQMKRVPHERLALVQAGMIVIFFENQWNNWPFFSKCALLIHWWPAIAKRVKKAKAPIFLHVPLNWKENGQLRKASMEDPRKLKIEHQIKAQAKVRKERKKKKREAEVQQLKAAQASFLDVLEGRTTSDKA